MFIISVVTKFLYFSDINLRWKIKLFIKIRTNKIIKSM